MSGAIAGAMLIAVPISAYILMSSFCENRSLAMALALSAMAPAPKPCMHLARLSVKIE